MTLYTTSPAIDLSFSGWLIGINKITAASGRHAPMINVKNIPKF